MATIICRCGVSFEGDAAECSYAYRKHDCPHHKCESVQCGWPEVVGSIAFLIFLSFICTHGWGMFR